MIKYYFNFYKRYLKSFGSIRPGTGRLGSGYPSIGLINTSIGTTNLGDLIIYDAVYQHLRSVFSDAFLTNYPSHLHRGYDAKVEMSKDNILFVGGTNLLSSNMEDRYQWKLDPMDKLFLKNKIVLMGVGWWQYQNKPNSYTQSLYKSVLSKDFVHSVRDSYTANMLKSIGIENVVNTTCPTLWNLSPEHCSTITTKKAKNVLTTLTFYKRDASADFKLLDILVRNYENVYLWIQGLEDLNYLKEIFPEYQKIHLVPPTMEAYNAILQQDDIEYLGTRLHAGVRAIQYRKRALIVAVDNRAIEISKDTNLNVIDRKEVERIQSFIESDYITNIKLPTHQIEQWKSQFLKKI